MKYILILSAILLTACGGTTDSDGVPEELIDIEMCLDQGGSWTYEGCVFDDEEEFYFQTCNIGKECPLEGE